MISPSVCVGGVFFGASTLALQLTVDKNTEGTCIVAMERNSNLLGSLRSVAELDRRRALTAQHERRPIQLGVVVYDKVFHLVDADGGWPIVRTQSDS